MRLVAYSPCQAGQAEGTSPGVRTSGNTSISTSGHGHGSRRVMSTITAKCLKSRRDVGPERRLGNGKGQNN